MFVFNPDIILYGWLGSEHQQTNQPTNFSYFTFFFPSVPSPTSARKKTVIFNYHSTAPFSSIRIQIRRQKEEKNVAVQWGFPE